MRLPPVHQQVLTLLALVVLQASAACIHDQLQDDGFQKGDSGADTASAAALGDGPVNPNFRMVFDWSNFESDIGFGSAGAIYVRDVIMKTAETFFEKSIQVQNPATKNLVQGARTCTAPWQSGTNKGKCSIYAQALCGTAVVPSDHLIQAEICPTSSGPCSILPGKGVPNADLVVYVAAKATSSCSSGALAYAGACSLDQTTDRPLFGYINVCSGFVAGTTLAESHPYRTALLDVMIVVHELTHVLGFAKNLFPYWRNSNGSPRTPRKPDGSPQALSSNTILVVNERGGQISKLVTEKVREAVQTFFNCPTADGAELEDSGRALPPLPPV